MDRKGGALGLLGLSEVKRSTPNLVDTAEKWSALTGSRSRPIALTSDINLNLVSGNQHIVQSLTFEVRSLEAVRAFLSSRGMLGASSEDEIALDLHATDGLQLKFREAKLETQKMAAATQ